MPPVALGDESQQMRVVASLAAYSPFSRKADTNALVLLPGGARTGNNLQTRCKKHSRVDNLVHMEAYIPSHSKEMHGRQNVCDVRGNATHRKMAPLAIAYIIHCLTRKS